MKNKKFNFIKEARMLFDVDPSGGLDNYPESERDDKAKKDPKKKDPEKESVRDKYSERKEEIIMEEVENLTNMLAKTFKASKEIINHVIDNIYEIQQQTSVDEGAKIIEEKSNQNIGSFTKNLIYILQKQKEEHIKKPNDHIDAAKKVTRALYKEQEINKQKKATNSSSVGAGAGAVAGAGAGASSSAYATAAIKTKKKTKGIKVEFQHPFGVSIFGYTIIPKYITIYNSNWI